MLVDELYYDSGEPIPPGYVSWNVKSLVQDWVNGTVPNYGFMVKCVWETGGIPRKMKMFYSNETSVPSQRPYLQIDYTKSRDRVINTPILSFLKDCPNLLPILRYILGGYN